MGKAKKAAKKLGKKSSKKASKKVERVEAPTFTANIGNGVTIQVPQPTLN